MALEFRLKIDRKYVQRHAEGYLGEELVGTRGDSMNEAACAGEISLTQEQGLALDRFVAEGIVLVVAPDGLVRLEQPATV